MFEDMTRAAILQAILSHMGDNVSKIEGSFASDQAAAVAVEMAKQYGSMDALLQVFTLATTEGEDLDRRAADYDITRKAGSKAAGTVTLSGTQGAILPVGAVVTTEDGLLFATKAEATILSDGFVSVSVESIDAGTAYNVPPGSITSFYRNYRGIEAVTNAGEMLGGADAETDEALRARVKLRLRAPATSGNKYHYQQWALEVDGVGSVRVLPLWAGNGTVKLVLASPTMDAVSETVVEACTAHIEAVRPIGAEVTVVSAERLPIDISANVELMTSVGLAEVRASFAAAADAYLRDIAFDAEVASINKIGYLLIGIPGVVDYAALTLNGVAANVQLTSGQVPALGTVTLNVSS